MQNAYKKSARIKHYKNVCCYWAVLPPFFSPRKALHWIYSWTWWWTIYWVLIVKPFTLKNNCSHLFLDLLLHQNRLGTYLKNTVFLGQHKPLVWMNQSFPGGSDVQVATGIIVNGKVCWVTECFCKYNCCQWRMAR